MHDDHATSATLKHHLPFTVYYLLIRELNYRLRDALAVVGGNVHDDGVAGFERVDDALEVFDGRDGLSVDALYDHELLHAGVEGEARLVNVLDEEAAHALQVALVRYLRRQLA